ncbi:MAG: cupredoxin domain-containing protein [Limnochordaceae bacterium]|nr:cupredoxin domain-containing protein [Limnochordaceae bacterium]
MKSSLTRTAGRKRPALRRAKLIGITAIIAAIMAVSWLFPSLAGSAGGQEREFVITARQFAFDPPRIYVNLGDRVTLRVRSLDITHGLYLDAYGLNIRVPPMEEGVVSFVADRPGKLRYRCSVICGPLHPFMVGEIVVQPNRLFHTGGVLAAIVGLGALAYGWWRKGG